MTKELDIHALFHNESNRDFTRPDISFINTQNQYLGYNVIPTNNEIDE